MQDIDLVSMASSLVSIRGDRRGSVRSFGMKYGFVRAIQPGKSGRARCLRRFDRFA
jgi:hypothetical protein